MLWERPEPSFSHSGLVNGNAHHLNEYLVIPNTFSAAMNRILYGLNRVQGGNVVVFKR
jgi:hypothetical protein